LFILIGDDGREKKKSSSKNFQASSKAPAPRRNRRGAQHPKKKVKQEKVNPPKASTSIQAEGHNITTPDLLNNIIPQSVTIKKPARTRQVISDYLKNILTSIVREELEKRVLAS
jgi:hypothetical protein